jgi:hypothetical protein
MPAKIGLRAAIIATAVFLAESIQLHHYYIAGAYVLIGSILSTKLEEMR